MASYTRPDQLSDPKDTAKGQLKGAADTVEGVATRAGQRTQEVAGTLRSALDKSMKDQPMATLAATAALAFLLGALWKR